MGVVEGRAAPADEARAVRHSKRREALAPGIATPGSSAGEAQATPALEGPSDHDHRSWPVRIARPSSPTRAARTDPGCPTRTFTP